MRPLFAVSLLVAILTTSAACRDRAAADVERARGLKVLGELPAFRLTDQSGSAFGADDLAGQVAIVNFIFTRCPTVCPVFTRKLKRIGERLDDVDAVMLVSISVDPEHDTPSVLSAFADKHDADPARWKFLTGDPELIQATMEKGLKLALEKKGVLEDGTPDIVHATHFVLIDSAGQIRGYYDSTEKERLDALVADARALAAVAR